MSISMSKYQQIEKKTGDFFDRVIGVLDDLEVKVDTENKTIIDCLK